MKAALRRLWPVAALLTTLCNGRQTHVDAAAEAKEVATRSARDSREHVRIFDRVWKDRLATDGKRQLYISIDRSPSSTAFYDRLWREIQRDHVLVYNGLIVCDDPTVYQYPECVALEAERGGWDCSGVVIAPNAILTAGHCYDSHHDSLSFGCKLTTEGGVQGSARIDERKRQCSPEVDMCVQIADLTPADGAVPTVMPVMATTSEIDAAQDAYLVGFGGANVKEWANGIKRRGIIPIFSHDCMEPDVKNKFQCKEGYELVAWKKSSGATDDQQNGACGGDSGGPVYVETAAGRRLAAITRYIDGHTDCAASFNVYMRIDKVEQWLRCVDGVQWDTNTWRTPHPCRDHS